MSVTKKVYACYCVEGVLATIISAKTWSGQITVSLNILLYLLMTRQQTIFRLHENIGLFSLALLCELAH